MLQHGKLLINIETMFVPFIFFKNKNIGNVSDFRQPFCRRKANALEEQLQDECIS